MPLMAFLMGCGVMLSIWGFINVMRERSPGLISAQSIMSLTAVFGAIAICSAAGEFTTMAASVGSVYVPSRNFGQRQIIAVCITCIVVALTVTAALGLAGLLLPGLANALPTAFMDINWAFAVALPVLLLL